MLVTFLFYAFLPPARSHERMSCMGSHGFAWVRMRRSAFGRCFLQNLSPRGGKIFSLEKSDPSRERTFFLEIRPLEGTNFKILTAQGGGFYDFFCLRNRPKRGCLI